MPPIKPNYATELNSTNPLVRDMVVAVLMSTAGQAQNKIWNYADPHNADRTVSFNPGQFSFETSTEGCYGAHIHHDTDGGQGLWIGTAGTGFDLPAPFTLMSRFFPTTDEEGSHFLGSEDPFGGADRVGVRPTGSDPPFSIRFAGSGTTYGDTVLAQETWYTVAVVVDDTTTTAYLDGIQEPTTANKTGTLAWEWSFGNFGVKIEFLYGWGRALSAAEIRNLTADPFQIFEPSVLVIDEPPAAGGFFARRYYDQLLAGAGRL